MLTRCPVCAGELSVARVQCGACGTAVEGHFTLGWIQRLSPEQLSFVRVFLECRGKIKDVEQALGISYPTVVSRLEEVVGAIRREPGAPPPDEGHAARRKQILDDLAAGVIDAAEAANRLKKAT